MESKKFSAELFGKHIEFLYEDKVIGYAILIMRLSMGWIFFQAGITKLVNPDWTAAGYLTNAIPEGNPFAGWFASMAGSGFVDALVIWGLLLIGIALIFGVTLGLGYVIFDSYFRALLCMLLALLGGVTLWFTSENSVNYTA